MSVVSLFLIFMSCSLIYLFIQKNYQILLDFTLLSDAARAGFFTDLISVIVLITLLNIIILMVASAYGIKHTHRTAGPLFNFKKAFGQIKNGHYSTRVKLRTDDDFHEVADAFNEMMDVIEKKLS